MILLLIFAFIAGIVTILSPCILPILPVILSSSVGTKKPSTSRPLGVVTGFIASFTFFTLFLSTLVRTIGISADALRSTSIVVIAVFGISLLIPHVQVLLERLFSYLTAYLPRHKNRHGFGGGFLIGLSLGLLWTPCVGPILAAVISLALSGTVTFDAFLITLAYAAGTAIPMFFIVYGGASLLHKSPWLLRNTVHIQKVFGVLMILTAFAIYTNLDRKFQTYILNTFPSYGTGLTKFEDFAPVTEQLNQIRPTNALSLVSNMRTLDDARQKGIPAPEIIPGGVWFNSDPLTLNSLKGKVVLIDFWTYTCINCQRTFPYLRDWWKKYEKSGLVIIGVHAPEFEFEKNPDNVSKAIADFKLTYPVVQDNDFATWQAYNNHYWPAKYLIDKDGNIRYTHFGEGDYDKTEWMIQELLKETGMNDLPDTTSIPQATNYARTPETYLGYSRMKGLTSPQRVTQNKAAAYTFPALQKSNTFGINGTWIIDTEYAQSSTGASLQFAFDAKEVYLVMNPTEGASIVEIRVDGIVQFRGNDVVQDGTMIVDTDRLYHLVSLEKPGRHTLTITFPGAPIELYAFTFG